MRVYTHTHTHIHTHTHTHTPWDRVVDTLPHEIVKMFPGLS